MGVFSKLKDIFYDIEYVEEEVKENTKPKNIETNIKEEEIINEKKPLIEKLEFPKREAKPLPTQQAPLKKEEQVREEIPERELFQSKKTFNFPILDDEEEKPKPKISRSSSTNIMDFEKNKQIKTNSNKKPTEKTFTPSPIISPVYGVLDKDFKKNQHVQKVVTTKEVSSKARDYDSVRRKAFGTMEDQIEDSINNDNVLEHVSEIEKELEKINVDEKHTHIDELLSEMKEDSLTIGEMESKTDNIKDLSEEVLVNEELTKNKKLDEIGDKTLEHDLFNLIDSMYEKEEE